MYMYLIFTSDSVEDIGIYVYTSVSIMYVCDYFIQCTKNWKRLLVP